MLKIPFHRPSLTSAEIDEVVATLKSGWLTTGQRTKQFEADFAQYLGQPHAVAVNSCTAALHLALEALGIQSGDGVLVPTMTFAATAEVVRYLGGTPILCDCRETDLNLDVTDARRRLLEAQARGIPVKAIIPVHYGGQIGDVSGVDNLAAEFGLRVIEDAAHCCPAFFWDPGTQGHTDLGTCGLGDLRSDGTTERRPGTGDFARGPADPPDGRTVAPSHCRTVGATADITCFSFYANKCITTGEGGMAITRNAEWADRMRIMSLHGISRDAWKRFTGEGNLHYEIIAPGYKYNLTDIAAAIGIHQLRRSDELHRQRQQIAAWYTTRLTDCDRVVLPVEQPGRIHSWHLYAIRLCLDRTKVDRARFIEELKGRGIGTSVHWMPLHLHPYYRDTFNYRPEDLPVATRLYPELITLPLFPGMTEQEVEYVADAVKTLKR